MILSFIFIQISIIGQNNQQVYFQGYTETVGGKGFGYHSPLPDVNTSLILRGRADYKSIEWKTEIVPTDYDKEFIRFIWVFGMDVTSSPTDFQLSVNNKPYISFSNSKTSDLGERSFSGVNGAELKLITTMLDKYDDQMGFAILKLPLDVVQQDKANILKLSSKSKGNDAWFMTFKSQVYEEIKVYQNQVVAKQDGKLFHSVSFNFIHVGENKKVHISIGDITAEKELQVGFNKLEAYLPKVDSKTTFTANIHIEGRENISRDFSVSPVKEWEIFLVQHTHTDIGYTRPQVEILPEHLRYIDHALDFCDYTDDYPDDAKFRWTCETSWSVREYLKSRPQHQIDRLIKRIKEGRIEVTGMFLNYSEIVDEPALAAQTKTLRFIKNQGIDVTTAMQNDVNGIAWCLVDYYHQTDVKYLNMGIHAHRARKPFNKPTSFWWQSPAGNRLLAYRSEHYQHANTLGVTSNQQDILMNNLSKYLKDLEDKDYPYDKISLQFSGYITDNSPPSTEVCDIIKEWNEKYEWPRLRSSLVRDFMIYLDVQHADDIPEKEVAWPDWWTDGVASAANETKEIRKTHLNISATTALFSMGKILRSEIPENIHQEIEHVYDNLLFYDEHTHGAAESVSSPLTQNTINQWGMKSAYAWEAVKKSHALEEKALAFLESSLKPSNLPSIAVFNTLNWERSGMVSLFLPAEIVAEGKDFTITDIYGKEIPYQRYEQRIEGAYFGLWVENIPPVGYKTLQINVGAKSKLLSEEDTDLLENKYYKINIDENKGVINSIYDKDLQLELLDPMDTLSLGQFIYEELDNRHEMERLTNSTRDTIYKPLTMKRSLLNNVKIEKYLQGAIYNSIFLNGDMPVCADENGVNIEIRLYHHEKKIGLLYQMIKLPVTDPESVYVAFPFKLPNAKLAYEAQGGIVYPGINQLEGTSSDWNCIQNFATVRGERSQIVFVSNEVPLVQFGAINTGRYYYRLRPQTNHIYSWVLNNYWVTNFKASQSGELQWSYFLTSSPDPSISFATQFGWGNRVPIKSRIIFPDHHATQTTLEDCSLLNLDVPNLLLVNTTPSLDGKGIILHLREVEGDHAILDIRRILEETGAITAHEVNVLEEEIAVLSGPSQIEHFETRFIKLSFE